MQFSRIVQYCELDSSRHAFHYGDPKDDKNRVTPESRYLYHLGHLLFNLKAHEEGPWVIMTQYRDGSHQRNVFDFAVVKVDRPYKAG